MEKSLLSFLATTAAVMIVANENLPGSPLVTPMLDKTTGDPKVDALGNELGSIRLEQHSRDLNGTYLNTRRRVAFVGGSLVELQKIVAANKYVDGSQVPGKIYIKESLEPMWPNQSPKMNPQTGEVIGVNVGDKFYPVFMQMIYTEDTSKKDLLIRTPEDVNAWLSARTVAQNAVSTVNTQQPAVPGP